MDPGSVQRVFWNRFYRKRSGNRLRNFRIQHLSRELIKENGWTAVSIRAVASRCSVSAGTIYNYYESKAALLGDTIESVWHEIFFQPQDEQVFQDVTACISWIYERLEYGNRQFPGFFSLHSLGFMKEEKTDGKKRMIRTWGHILNGLCEVLKNDLKIRPGVLWADVIPMIGMLMIPKTCAYVWTVLIGYKAMKKETV